MESALATALQDILSPATPSARRAELQAAVEAESHRAGAWDSYTGGVLTSAACGNNGNLALDHCVQAVGYNTTATTPYWIVRPSPSLSPPASCRSRASLFHSVPHSRLPGCALLGLLHCTQVRNSWSTNWGEEGYIYLAMGDNTCGLCNEATVVDLSN